jgi:hypothetical protein
VLVGSAEGMCARDEETWNDRSDYALRSMAETRAESRAYRRAVGWLVNLAGYNPTPAEEMGGGPGGATNVEPEMPAWARPATDARKKLILQALSYLIDGNERSDLAVALLQTIAREFGGIPDILVNAISWIARDVATRAAGETPLSMKGSEVKTAATTKPPAAAAPAPADTLGATIEAAAAKAREAAAAASAPPPATRFNPTTQTLEPDGPTASAEEILTPASVEHPDPPKEAKRENPTNPAAEYGESPAQHLARLRAHGCTCTVPFPINGHPASNNPNCPIQHDPIKF